MQTERLLSFLLRQSTALQLFYPDCSTSRSELIRTSAHKKKKLTKLGKGQARLGLQALRIHGYHCTTSQGVTKTKKKK